MNLYQYDLITTTQTLLHSETISTVKGGGLKRGPDNKIYFISNFASNYLGVIQNPDNAGILCNYNNTGLQFTFSGGWGALNFPNTLPAATISNVYDYQICQGSSITLTETGGVSYQWVPGTGLNATNTASVVATPTSDISYYSIIIDANNCATYNQHNIDVVPNTIQNLSASYSGGNPICTGDPVTITASGINVNYYTISPGTNVNFTTSITLNPTSTTTYTVTAHQGVCTSTVDLTVPVSDCHCTGGIELTTQYLIDHTVGNVISIPQNSTYVLNQNISIPNNCAFTNCEVKIAPGVEILVPGNIEFTVSRSYLHACNSMWKGIHVNSGGSVKIVGQNNNGKPSIIEDALTGVYFYGGTLGRALEVRNSIFNKNLTGIYVDTYNGSNYSNFNIDNSVFTCRALNLAAGSYSGNNTFTLSLFRSNFASDLSTNLDDQQIVETNYPSTGPNAYLRAPHSGKKSDFGLRLNQLGVTSNETSTNPAYLAATIGSNNINPNNYNLFDNQIVGIYAFRSNINVLNSKFQNIRHFNNSQATLMLKGRALFITTPKAAKSNIRVFRNSFVNCDYAAEVSNYFTSSFESNTIRSTQDLSQNYNPAANHIGKYGFVVTSNQYNTVNINTNLLYNIENAIVFNSIMGIYDNGGGAQTNAQYSGQVNIQQNVIQPEYTANMANIANRFVRHAIIANNVIGGTTLTNVSGSTLSITNNMMTQVNQGVQVMNWRKNILIEDNDVILRSSGINGFVHAGILYDNNLNSTIIKNRIQRNNISGFGIGSNTNSFGIRYGVSTNTNIFCNNVSNTYMGLNYSGSSTGSVNKRNTMNTHRYGFVLDGTGTGIGPQGNTFLPADNIFDGTWTGGNFMTATMNGASPVGNQMFVHNSAPYNPNLSSTNILPFSSIPYSNPSTIIYSNGLLQTCPTVMLTQNGNTDLLDMRDNIKKRLNGEIPIVVNPIEGDYNSKKQIYALLQNDQLLSLGDNDLQNFVLENENSNHGKLERIQKNLTEGNLQMASMELLSLESNAIDENFKQFDEIYMAYLNDSLNTNDSLNLTVLGNKCPLLDGSVVYQARAMYGVLFGYNYVFTDGCLKNINEGEKSIIQQINWDSNTMENEILVYPNPNKGKFYIKAVDSINLIKVFDLQGREIYFKQNKINETALEIELDSADGVYNLQLINKNEVQFIKIKVFN